jgi:integrase
MRGNITKRGKASWQIKFDTGTIDGKRKFHYCTVRGTYKDAQRELTRLLGQSDSGTLPRRTSATVGEYVNNWFKSAHTQSPKTLERYQQLADKQIIPHLGANELQKLTPEDVQRWHGTLLKSGLARRTVAHTHRLLRLVLQSAVKNGLLARNVADVNAPPKAEDTEMVILLPEQVSPILEALKGRSLYPIVVTAIATVMRRGELLGLQLG